MDYLRAKQAGIPNDLTRTLSDPNLFLEESVANFGISSQISTIAFDPIQSLLAVGTYVALDGTPGEVYIFGLKRVQVSFSLERKASVKYIKFCDKKLVVLDSKHDLTIISLETRTVALTYSPPGGVSAIVAEAGLDWVFLGLQNGDVIAYDLDRCVLSPFRITNLWKERSTKAISCPVISLALHPRDIGTILIGYLEGAVVFSFKQNKPTLFLQFELPPGAPGADADPATINTIRRPKLAHATWHPTGTFIMTAHEDSCMVFWDPKDGRIIQTRTLQDSHVHLPGGPLGISPDAAGIFSVREPIYKVAWCSGTNPDVTSLLIAGGNPTAMPAKGLTLLDLGATPPYLTSSWEVLSEHFASPKRQRILPTPTAAGVIDFCLIPRTSPHYDGANDPLAVIAVLASGELAMMNFPDGLPLSPTYLLPVSLSFVHPTVNIFNMTLFDRKRWLGMEEKREKPPIFLEGGSALIKPSRKYEIRPVIQTAHTDGTLRIWDASHADEVENPDIIEVDLSRVLLRTGGLTITAIGMSGMTGELAVGMEAGEVVIFNWRKAAPFGTLKEVGSPDGPIVDLKARADPKIREGLLPLFMLIGNTSPVVAIKSSDIGFIAVAHGDGQITVLDLRGPAVIFTSSLSNLTKEHSGKRLSFHKHSASANSNTADPTRPVEVATALEFSVMTLDEDLFSSISLFVGTSTGRVGTFKILPGDAPGGVYKVEYVGVSNSTVDEQAVVNIIPINIDTGELALASQFALLGLRNGVKVPGALIITTKSEVRLYRPATAKGAHKSWGPGEGGANVCVTSGVVQLDGYGMALVVIMSSGIGKVFSIPGLKEVKEFSVKGKIEKSRLSEARILATGDIYGPSTATSIVALTLFGKGTAAATHAARKDELYNPLTPPPPRPTISNFQWLSGTQHLTLADFDLLIGGPDRPLSKIQIEAARAEKAEAKAQALAEGAGGSGSAEGAGSAAGKPVGIWEGLQKGFNERTKQLSNMGESMDRLGESSSAFSEEVAKMLKEQKKKALLGGLKAKFF